MRSMIVLYTPFLSLIYLFLVTAVAVRPSSLAVTAPSSPSLPIAAGAGSIPYLGTNKGGDNGVVAPRQAAAAAALYSYSYLLSEFDHDYDYPFFKTAREVRTTTALSSLVLGSCVFDDRRPSAFRSDDCRCAALHNASFPSLINHFAYQALAPAGVLVSDGHGDVDVDGAAATGSSSTTSSGESGVVGGALPSVLVDTTGYWNEGRPGRIQRAAGVMDVHGVGVSVDRTTVATATTTTTDDDYDDGNDDDDHDDDDDRVDQSETSTGDGEDDDDDDCAAGDNCKCKC